MKWSVEKVFILLAVPVALLMFLVLAGCGDESVAPTPVPQKEIQAVKNAPPKTLVEAHQGEQTPVDQPKYVYLPGNRRDPFKPLVEVRKPIQTKRREIPEDELTPLQKYDVGQFRLLGVIVGKGSPTAMVLAPDGKSYILRSGIKIGKNDGIVVGVGAEGVKVKEFFYDFSGEVRTGIQEIRLPTAGGEK